MLKTRECITLGILQIGGSHRVEGDVLALLDWQAAPVGSGLLPCLTLQDETYRLSRNVGKLPIYDG